MHSTLTIARYPKWYSLFGFFSMAVFHFYLRRNKNIFFYKLMGSGKNGTFDVQPDLRQWAILCVFKNDISTRVAVDNLYGNFIASWWKKLQCEVMTVALQPIEGHGKWDGSECFGALPKTSAYEGLIAVLTRASIRLSKVKSFWKNVSDAAQAVHNADGFITSFGIGEVPWIKQATFSVWQSKEAMKAYAYKQRSHQQVIQKTRKEAWYSEEMFVRFKILWTSGTVNGKNEIEKFIN